MSVLFLPQEARSQEGGREQTYSRDISSARLVPGTRGETPLERMKTMIEKGGRPAENKVRVL